MRLDVLVVASHRDYGLTAHSLRNLVAYLPDLGTVTLATDRPADGRALVDRLGLVEVTVLPDRQLLSTAERRLPGWYRQQLIKLRAGSVLSGDTFAVLSGDTLLARRLPATELLAPSGRPYLYVNRYRYPAKHLEYERRRVTAVAELLGVIPTVAWGLGDFICDLFCFERTVLTAAIGRLQSRYGWNWTRVLAGRGTRPEDQNLFGEYTLYAVTALECFDDRPPVRVRRESHVLQIHSRRAFELARFDAPVVHLVDKRIPIAALMARAAQFGQDLTTVAPDSCTCVFHHCNIHRPGGTS